MGMAFGGEQSQSHAGRGNVYSNHQPNSTNSMNNKHKETVSR